jgi:hypothetical protein
MKDLFNGLNSATVNEKKKATRLITINDPYNEKDFTSEDEQNNESNDANKAPYITAESLNRARKNGPFGKLHNINVHLRQNSQLQQAFPNAQQPYITPLTWVHNMATR